MRRKIPAVMLAVLMGVCALGLTGCAAKEKIKYQTTFLNLFDTVTSITGYEESEEAFNRTAARIHDEMEAYDHLYDIYHEYPDTVNLCTVNRRAGETVTVDRRIMDLLVFARQVDEFSGHRTNAMFGAVLREWHEAREYGISSPENAYLPDGEKLRAAEKHTGFDLIEMDEESCTVRITDPEASLDVGALAKGYAVQKVSETLPEGDLLSVGGNVVATGPKPDGSLWTIGVADPEKNGETYLQKVGIGKGTVVTSGDYQRYYVVDGTRYSHIIDPETLYPGTKWRGVTVICDDSGLGDALSTSLFLLDRETGQELLNRFGAKAMWIDADGKLLFSDGYERMGMDHEEDITGLGCTDSHLHRGGRAAGWNQPDDQGRDRGKRQPGHDGNLRKATSGCRQL